MSIKQLLNEERDTEGCITKPALSPVEFFELFVLAYARACGTARDHVLFRGVDEVRDSIFRGGLEHGRREGYHQALHEMQQATGDAGEFLQTLMLK